MDCIVDLLNLAASLSPEQKAVLVSLQENHALLSKFLDIILFQISTTTEEEKDKILDNVHKQFHVHDMETYAIRELRFTKCVLEFRLEHSQDPLDMLSLSHQLERCEHLIDRITRIKENSDDN